MKITWSQSAGKVWIASAGPFVLKVLPKGDGRWSWHVFRSTDDTRSKEASNPVATGVANSVGGAKATADQFVQRSGFV